MYKLVKRYYGELCDKEQIEDKEVYDEEVIIDNKPFSWIKYELSKAIEEEKQNDFILDDNFKYGNRTVIMFLGKQENWNAYIEFEIINTDLKSRLKDIADKYEQGNKEDFDRALLRAEDDLGIHYQEIKNKVFESIIKQKLKLFKGKKTFNNQEFIDYIKSLENEFECEIDLIDLTVTPLVL